MVAAVAAAPTSEARRGRNERGGATKCCRPARVPKLADGSTFSGMSLQTPAQITFHQMDHSDILEADIRDKIDQLDAIYGGLISCRVVVEYEHFNNKHDPEDRGPVVVRFEVGVPGGKTIIGGGPGTANSAFEDPFMAARASFEAARRQLQDYVDKRRGFTKTHADDDVALSGE